MSEASDMAMKIGDILMRSGLSTVEQLEEAVKVADKMQLSLKRVMEMNAWLSDRAFNAAVTLTERVTNKEIPLETALKVLDLISKQGLDIDSAIRQLSRGLSKEDKSKGHKLGELMREAGMIQPPQLNQGLYHSLNARLPLGLVLVDTDVVSRSMLESALSAQTMIRDNVISHQQAVQALRAARLRHTTFEQSLIDHGFSAKVAHREFGVGELLALASVITETQLLAGREVALDSGRPIEEVLTRWGLASSIILQAAENLVGMIKEGALFEDQAAAMIRKLRRARTNEEAAQILNNFQEESEETVVDLLQLLQLCGLVAEEDIARATPIALQHRAPLIKVLIDGGLLQLRSVELANECKHYVDTSAIELDQGIIALLYAIEHEISMTESLDRFGWGCTFAAV
ncbi:MAG TPA: hypothetical protein V6C81_30085 [Planktothrix sp.]|jgi:hypothetical protein